MVTDSIGNRTDVWTNWYTCRATLSGESGSEENVAGQTVDGTSCAFTVRYCSNVKYVNSEEYRVIYNGEIYNITGVDHLNNRRKAIKLRCSKAGR